VQGYAAENSLLGQLFIHFGLRENPFGVTPDARFLYHSRTHREALASLINGIDCGFGFQVLIAQPGMGKTSLLFNLLGRFRTTAHTAFLFQPQREPHDLLQSVLYELGTSSEETSLCKLLEQLNQVLYRAAQERKRVIVLVDEAQNLEFAVLEALRQLSNFETPHIKPMQIVLVGQPQLAEKLAAPEQEQLLQRISAIGRLSPLALDETQAYINHRLTTAGYSGVDLFTQAGVRMVWNLSKGVPRNINTLCFSAMLLAFAEHAKSIDERILKEAARDLDLNSMLADVYQMEPSVAVLGGNGKVQPIRKTTQTGNARPGAIEEPVAGTGSISREARTSAASARLGDRNTAGAGENIPPSLVEALIRISQALEEQRLMLMAKSAALPQPLSVLPVIPLHTTAAEATETPASSGRTSLPPSTPIENSTVAANRGGPTANLEKNSPLKTAEREVRSERKSTSDPAQRQPGKARAEPSVISEVPVMHGYQPTAKKRSEKGSLWPKALALAAFSGVLALVLVGKFPSPRPGKVEARVPDRSGALQNDPAAGYSLPAQGPAASTDGPGSPATDFRDPRTPSSDQSEEVVVRTFPTDLNVASKNSGNKQELSRIFFDEESDVIGLQYRPWLQQIADTLAEDPTASVILEGHTDGFGPRAYNLDLSSRRAIAVLDALVNELHVSRTRLTAIGAGAAAPLQPNSTTAGRAYNRRVEVRLIHSSK
jgi:type II secretory pathway predicted ATPase ExeA/outer membrane protein OmpA-like peptidoglycan-associated protein